MAAWLGRSVDWLVLPERPSAPRRGDFSSGMWKGAGSQEPGAAAARVQGVARRARQVRSRLPAAGSGREQLGGRAAAQEGG